MDPSADLPTGWCAFTDEKTQRTYYAHTSGLVRWDRPPNPPPPPPMPPVAPAVRNFPPPPMHPSAAPPMAEPPSNPNPFLTPTGNRPQDPRFSLPPQPVTHPMYQANPVAMMPIPVNVPPPMLRMNSNYQPHGLKRPADWAYQANKRPFYGVPEELSKTCSRCNKECKKDDYAKRQWLKKDGERKCTECVKAVLAANKAIVENIHGIAPASGILCAAEKVSPSSSVTNDQSSEAKRICSRCKLPHDWTKFTKTQWVAAALVRKCKECLEEEKQIKKRVDQEQGIQALLMMSGQVSESTEDPMKAALKAAADLKAAQAAKFLANPDAVSSMSNTTNVTDLKGILKPASHDSTSPDLIRSDVVVKEEAPSGLVLGGPTVTNEEGSYTDSTGAGSAGAGLNSVGIKVLGTPNMRQCSKCHRVCDHTQYSKTQWLMSSIFRRCKRCMDDDAEAVKAVQRTQDINDRRFMYGDTSKPRECASCGLELEWDKFSKRQWIAVECARRCKACVNKSLAELAKAI